MDTNRLTDYEYNCVVQFIRKQLEDPHIYTRMWVEGYRSLFNPDSYLPMQMVNFYVIVDRKIAEYHFMCDTSTISFNEFKNRIIESCRNNNIELIGPYVPKDSSVKELVDIIRFYEDHYCIRFNETPFGYQEDKPADNPTDKPASQSGGTVSNLI